MGTKLQVDNNKNLYEFWREKITYLMSNKPLFSEFKHLYSSKFEYQIDFDSFYRDSKSFKFNSIIQEAYLNRIPLSSTGFYSTPKFHFNKLSLHMVFV